MVAAYQNPDYFSAPLVHAFIASQYGSGATSDPDDWPVAPDATEVPLADVERATGISFRVPRGR
jgi:hypothetical protein